MRCAWLFHLLSSRWRKHWRDRCRCNRGSALARATGIWHLVCPQERLPSQWVFFISLNFLLLKGDQLKPQVKPLKDVRKEVRRVWCMTKWPLGLIDVLNYESASTFLSMKVKSLELYSGIFIRGMFVFWTWVILLTWIQFFPLQRRLKGKRISFSWAWCMISTDYPQLDWYNPTIFPNARWCVLFPPLPLCLQQTQTQCCLPAAIAVRRWRRRCKTKPFTLQFSTFELQERCW